ncbi:thioester reductase domain-containing protein [Streptomyces sp. S.PNR 29]|uniref:thioester reductase domain-containing protein n=1 Tax=Streptomyces sp. S.PNR 29 TaxID=2973805 RepID=UPI0025B0DFE5|nr:thioester reductase domain-containing protein [Streptomyces sp. S.PNR 29]MDN0196780.1 thioester reductase domain-containing protein [Streptomyces sp. S.PNR 29]
MNTETAIAVVGIGCRFPDAVTPQEFWDNLDKGQVSIRDIPDEELRRAGVAPETSAAADFVARAGTLQDAEQFAAEFFGYPPVEAELIDPQQRLFLEVCWEALERSGHPPHDEAGPRIGVFAGTSHSSYTSMLQFARARAHGAVALGDLTLQLGGSADFMAARVAYKLGLRGPSVAVQTACSSSLTAVHYAVISLLSEECDIAMAGGTGLAHPPAGYRYQPGGVLSEDGYCRAFDIRSSGTGAGSGVGVVVLRRLNDALADGDPVLAVIRGSAVGNDGGGRPGFTAPSPAGVADVVAGALGVAEVGADELRYVEAHGSGTPLGDQVELRGLIDGLRATTSRSGYCALGTVKANIGHAGSAAGIAGLIKAVHVARTGHLVPHPMFERPRDPGVLAVSPFHIPTELQQCTEPDRQVLVNSMGLGGTNAAVVLAPPPPPTRPSAGARPVVRLQLSARTRTELDALSRSLADEIDQDRHAPADIAHTLRTGRHDFAERRLVAAAPDRLAAALRLPRPPAARTVRAQPRRAVVAVTAPQEKARRVLPTLLAGLGGRVEQCDAIPASLPSDVYLLVVGDADPGPDRHVLRVGTDSAEEPAEQVAAALADAWLHGVPVHRTPDDGTGLRVPLPTYPFTRHRYSALDGITLDAHSPTPAPASAPVATDREAGGLEGELLTLWEELFGVTGIGPHDEFGALGGNSLLGLRMVLEVQSRYGMLLNLHRVGGSQATVVRVADAIRGWSAEDGARTGDASDSALIDADLARELPPLRPRQAEPGQDVLLTGATGFVGAFLLDELLRCTEGRVYCLVRAEDEAHGRRRLREAARRFRLPEPDPQRVHIVPGDLGEIAEVCETYRDGELGRRVGHVLHCAAHVVFTEPYPVLRAANTLATHALLGWMRTNGIVDISYVSTLAACGRALGTGDRLLERREQPLDPAAGGYGISKWVSERILEQAERDGMRVRVFRPGLIAGATTTGACNDLDMMWRLVAACLAVGAYPLDDNRLAIAPVDLVARAIVELGTRPGSVGQVYHLVGESNGSLPELFAELAGLGMPTRGVSGEEWVRLVSERALATGDPVLSSMALYENNGVDAPRWSVESDGWQDWLRTAGLDPRLDGARALHTLRYLAGRPEFQSLLTGLPQARPPQDRDGAAQPEDGTTQ